MRRRWVLVATAAALVDGQIFPYAIGKSGIARPACWCRMAAPTALRPNKRAL